MQVMAALIGCEMFDHTCGTIWGSGCCLCSHGSIWLGILPRARISSLKAFTLIVGAAAGGQHPAGVPSACGVRDDVLHPAGPRDAGAHAGQPGHARRRAVLTGKEWHPHCRPLTQPGESKFARALVTGSSGRLEPRRGLKAGWSLQSMLHASIRAPSSRHAGALACSSLRQCEQESLEKPFCRPL